MTELLSPEMDVVLKPFPAALLLKVTEAPVASEIGFEMNASVADVVKSRSCVPLAILIVPEPTDAPTVLLVLLIPIVPASKLIGPDSPVLSEFTVSVPLPAFVNPLVPASSVDTVVFTLVVIVGLVPARVSVFAPANTQEPAVAVSVSPKVMLPIVRAVSTVTVTAPGISIVLKSALLPEPSATVPPDQSVVSLQFPDAVDVQVPDSAFAASGMSSGAMASRVLYLCFMVCVWIVWKHAPKKGITDMVIFPCLGEFP